MSAKGFDVLLELTAVSLSMSLNPPALFFFRSIPSPENVPRGSWLLDDHVLQHHPLPLHLLTHLQPLPADGWEHEVSHSTSLSRTHLLLPLPLPASRPHHFLELLYTPPHWLIDWNILPQQGPHVSPWGLRWGAAKGWGN